MEAFKNEETTWTAPDGALTLEDVLSAPGVERVDDPTRHLDGWFVRYESPVFQAVVAAVALGAAHGHGGYRSCFLYMTEETVEEGGTATRQNFYPVWWRPDSKLDLAQIDHHAVKGSDPTWWASGVNADGVYIPNCGGRCPELGQYGPDGWEKQYEPSLTRNNCRGLALDHGTATGRLTWTVTEDAVQIKVFRPYPDGTFSEELREAVRMHPAPDHFGPDTRTPWSDAAEALEDLPPMCVAEVTLRLKRPYGPTVWAPIHERGMRPRHVDALMTAVNAVLCAIGYEPDGDGPLWALHTLHVRFGAGVYPDRLPDDFPVGVHRERDPKSPYYAPRYWVTAAFGDPEAPEILEPAEE